VVRALARAMRKSYPYKISWCLAREVLEDDVVIAGPNHFNGQSRVLKIDGTNEYFNDALLEDDKYIQCGGCHSKV
jgi:hypothetical protein